MGAIIQVVRHADDQQLGLPLPDEFIDGRPVRFLSGIGHGRQTLGGMGDLLADGDTNAACSKIKSKQGPGHGGVVYQAWPTSLERFFNSTPRWLAEAVQRCSMGVPKMIAGSAGPLSQAFWANSISS